jgi:hypothetical protein
MGEADGRDKAYVPPDLESTGEIPVDAQPASDAGLFDDFFTEEDATGRTGPSAHGVRRDKARKIAGARPGGEPPDRDTSFGPQARSFPVADARPHPPLPPASRPRPSRRMLAAVAAAGAAVIVAGAITMLFRQPGGASNIPGSCTGKSCSSSTLKKNGAAGSPAGQKLRYRTVDRQTGYFEGTVTIVNKGSRPMPSWTLSFTYPGADVHNAWEVVLQQTGRNVVINSATTAQPIAPGDSFEVRFGGAGTPGLPTDCRLNGRPCTFTE